MTGEAKFSTPSDVEVYLRDNPDVFLPENGVSHREVHTPHEIFGGRPVNLPSGTLVLSSDTYYVSPASPTDSEQVLWEFMVGNFIKPLADFQRSPRPKTPYRDENGFFNYGGIEFDIAAAQIEVRRTDKDDVTVNVLLKDSGPADAPSWKRTLTQLQKYDTAVLNQEDRVRSATALFRQEFLVVPHPTLAQVLSDSHSGRINLPRDIQRGESQEPGVLPDYLRGINSDLLPHLMDGTWPLPGVHLISSAQARSITP